jgi:glycosyltransferase involved in cell wall biosynthesis
MNICVVGSSKKFYSGISAYTVVMANALARNGHNVSVVLLRNLVPLVLYPGRERVGKHEMLTDFLPEIDVFKGMDWNSPRSWLQANRFIRQHHPDVIIMHWWTSTVAHMQIFLALTRFFTGRPWPERGSVERCKKISDKPVLLLEMHEVIDPLEESILPIRIYSRIAGKGLLGLCDGYIAHSEDAISAVSRTYNIMENKIFNVHMGPCNNYVQCRDSGVKSETEPSLSNHFIILSFGSIRKYKGISFLLRAFSLLPNEVAHYSKLLIAGEDWGDDQDIYSIINESPHKEQIIFRPGFVADKEVSRYFSAADVVVLPYLRTCGSGVVSVALSYGKSIISSDLPTMRETLSGYEGAKFFPSGDVEALKGRILEFFMDGKNGGVKEYSYAGITWDKSIEMYEKVIHATRRRL